MKKEEIFKHIHQLLDKACIPMEYQTSAITRMINSTRYDMNLKVDIMEHSTRVFCYERGVIVIEKHLENSAILEYLMLSEVIGSYYSMLAWKEHVDSNGYIDIEWERDAIKDAFNLIGEPYNGMYKNKMSLFNI